METDQRTDLEWVTFSDADADDTCQSRRGPCPNQAIWRWIDLSFLKRDDVLVCGPHYDSYPDHDHDDEYQRWERI